MASPIEWSERPWFHLQMTFVEGLIPSFARERDSSICRRDLEGGTALGDNRLRQIPEIFHRDRLAPRTYPEDIVHQGFSFGRSEILTFSGGPFPRRSPVNAVPVCGGGRSLCSAFSAYVVRFTLFLHLARLVVEPSITPAMMPFTNESEGLRDRSR